jgi:hypothetical protein
MSARAVVNKVTTDSEAVDAVVTRLRSQGIEIMDEQPNMLLVSGSKPVIENALGEAHGWRVSEVTMVPPPRTRPRILKKP